MGGLRAGFAPAECAKVDALLVVLGVLGVDEAEQADVADYGRADGYEEEKDRGNEEEDDADPVSTACSPHFGRSCYRCYAWRWPVRLSF